MARGGRVVVAGVCDTETAAGAKLARLELQLVAQLDEEVEHDLHRLLVRAKGKDLRSQVRMESDHLQPRMSQRFSDRVHGCA